MGTLELEHVLEVVFSSGCAGCSVLQLLKRRTVQLYRALDMGEPWSSRRCSACAKKYKVIQNLIPVAGTRNFRCPCCGVDTTMDRDLNATVNQLHYADSIVRRRQHAELSQDTPDEAERRGDNGKGSALLPHERGTRWKARAVHAAVPPQPPAAPPRRALPNRATSGLANRGSTCFIAAALQVL